jgi:hypothetical protein
MRIQSTHSHADRGLDPYFTPECATRALLEVEHDFIPHLIWEPAAGDGAIVRVLERAGYDVVYASDIADYGEGFDVADYLTCDAMIQDDLGIITNPPFKLAEEFVRKALLRDEVAYLALLLRTNFLEGVKRRQLFEDCPLSRVWISSRRLPMMHRFGWEGPKSTSNTCYAWFVWNRNPADPVHPHPEIRWFDWAELYTGP